MKVEELMIGDIVRVAKDVCLKEGTIVIISGIDANNELPRKKLQGSVTCFELGDELRIQCGVWAEYLEPIPLIPKILEKNGFEYHRDAGYIDNDYNGTQIIYDSWNRRLKIFIEYNVALDIDSFREMRVHELQHALKLCGIYKEITL